MIRTLAWNAILTNGSVWEGFFSLKKKKEDTKERNFFFLTSDGYLPLIARLVTDIIRSRRKKSEKPSTREEGTK